MCAMPTPFALAAFAAPAIVDDTRTDDIEDHMRSAICATRGGIVIRH